MAKPAKNHNVEQTNCEGMDQREKKRVSVWLDVDKPAKKHNVVKTKCCVMDQSAHFCFETWWVFSRMSRAIASCF